MAGPTIASAEVDVDFDGSTLPAQARKIATTAGRAFSGEFGNEVNSHMDSLLTPTGRDITQAMGDIGEESGKNFSRRIDDSIRSGLSNFDDDLADAIVSGDWNAAIRKFDNLDEAAESLGIRIRELRDQGHLTGKEFDKAAVSFGKFEESLKNSEKEMRQVAAANKRQVEATRDADFAMKVYLDRVKTSVATQKAQAKAAEKVETALRKNAAATKSSNDEEGRSFSILGRLSGARNDFFNIVGKSARLLEGLPQLFSKLGGGFSTLSSGLEQAYGGMSKFEQIATVARNGLSGMAKGIKGLAGKGGLVGVAVTVGILAAALLALGNAVTGVAAGLSGLVGIVTALAASLTAALGGALLSVGPMIGALVAGVGGLTLAIVKNQDAFSGAIKPLTAWADEVGKAAGKAALPAIRDAVESLGKALKVVKPLLVGSAGAIAGWAKSFAQSMSSGPMLENLKVFRDTWPDILSNLGRGFTNAFAGVSGILAAISPSVERFTDAIADGLEKFNEWANKDANQNSIKEWFDGAWESAKLLWGILKNVATAIGNLFSQGKDTGDGFLQSLEDVTGEFAKWTEKPEGRKAISDWFKDAKDLASTLADFIGDIGEKFDEWDTERNREDFNDMLDTISGIVEGVMQIVTGLNAAADWLADMDAKADSLWDNIGGGIGDWFTDQFDEIGTAWQGVLDWWDNTAYPWITQLGPNIAAGFKEGWDNAWNGLGAWWAETWRGLIQAVKDIFGIASPSTVFASIGTDILMGLLQGLQTAWNLVSGWFTGTLIPFVQSLPGRIMGALGTLGGLLAGWATSAWNTAYGAVVTAAGRIVSFVKGLPSRIVGAVQSLGSMLAGWASSAWNRAYTAISGVVNRILGFLRGLPSRVIGAVQSLGGLLSGWASSAWNRAYTAISGVVNRIVSFVRGVPGRIVGAVQSLGGLLSGWATSAWNRAYSAVTSAAGRIMTYVRGIPGRIMGSLGNLGTLLYGAGQSIVQGLYNGLVSAWGRVTGWASRAAAGLSGAVKKVLGIASPSKVFMEIGKNTAEGFIIGFRKTSEKGRSAFKTVAASTLVSMTDGLAKGSKEAGAETKRILAKVQDMQLAALKSNQRALKSSVTAARKGLSGVKETSTVKDLKEYYAGVNRTVKDAGAALRATIKKNGASLTATLKQYETSTAQLTAAKKKLDELKKASTQLRDSVKSSITGQLNLGSLTSENNDGVKPTFGGISSYVKSMKSKAQSFATKMKKLVKAGLPPAFIQELAGLGLDGAIEVANALLGATPKQLRSLSADFNAFTSAAGSIGTSVANSMYKTGIEAQKGLIQGLTEQTGDLKKAAKTLTDRLTKYVKKNLGIKSPSRVFATIGEQLMAGLAGGIDAGAAQAISAAGAVVSAVSGVGSSAALSPTVYAGGQVAPVGRLSAGTGRNVVVQTGAIQVNTNVQDPRLVASQVLDRLVARMV